MLLKEDYDRVGKSWKAQRLFRKRWAAAQADELEAKITQEKTDTFSEIDESIGEYVSIAQIYRDEGGESTNPVLRRDGIIATKNYLSWCMLQKNF